LKIPGQPDIQLIPGFKVESEDQNFKIKFKKGAPELSGSGSIKITLPYEKEPLIFSGKIDFEDKSLKMSGDQQTPISKLFGIEGLIVDGCHADISWDASSFNPVPKSANITGKIHSGKSNLELKLDFSLDDKKKVNFGVTSVGNLFVKDFVQFWLNLIINDPKITAKVLPVTPDVKLEDVEFIAKWADKEEDRKLSLDVKKADIKFDEVAVAILSLIKDEKAKTEIKKYLNKFSITRAKAEYYKKGIRVESTTSINGKPVNLVLEGCKDETKGWYALFYIDVPEKWRVSELIPDFLNAKVLFPNLKIDSKDLDILELSESTLYISTIDMEKHDKIGKVVEGASFKGKAKFVGILGDISQKMALNDPLEMSGTFIPKVFGSELAIKIPTNLTIFPQSITVGGKTTDLIKGFQVDLTPFKLKMKIIDALPYVKLESDGGILVTVPFLKDKLDFFAKIALSARELALSGGQRNTMNDAFGVKGLGLHNCEIGLKWDFATSATIYGLPTGFIVEGGLESQKSTGKKCSLHIATSLGVSSTAAVDLKYTSSGTLFVKDFAEFWLDTIVKTPNKQSDEKFKKDFMKVLTDAKVTDWVFEDVFIKGAWAEDAKKGLY
jgi:hypothetical protein